MGARQFPPLNLQSIQGVTVAGQLASRLASQAKSQSWGLDYLGGRLVQVSGAATTAALTMVVRLVLEAQQRREPVVWIAAQESSFFPPDLALSGVDLEALPVVRVKKGLQAARAADTLLRSGGFALVVLDLENQQSMSLAVQTRLAGLAKRYQVVLAAVTRSAVASGASSLGASSLGAMVSLRGECTRKRTAFDRFTCEVQVMKDKRGGPGWRHLELCRGPDGLC